MNHSAGASALNPIDKVAWIYVRDTRVLSTRSRGRSIFYLPGGKRETGESDLQTLRREILEELQVELEDATIVPFGSFESQADGHPRGVRVKMTCYAASPIGEPTPAAEIEEVCWLQSSAASYSSAVDKLVFARAVALGLID